MLCKVTAEQLRAARALLRMPVEKLAVTAGVSAITIRRAEAQGGPVRMMPANSEALRRALEAAGVKFIFEADGGVGVVLRAAPVNT